MAKSLLVLLLSAASVSAHGGDHDSDSDADADSGDGDSPNLRSKSLILVKVWCLILIFVGTFIGGVSPYFFKWNEGFLALGTQFAGGVFLGTALMHFLNDANDTFKDLTDKDYPFCFYARQRRVCDHNARRLCDFDSGSQGEERLRCGKRSNGWIWR